MLKKFSIVSIYLALTVYIIFRTPAIFLQLPLVTNLLQLRLITLVLAVDNRYAGNRHNIIHKQPRAPPIGQDIGDREEQWTDANELRLAGRTGYTRAVRNAQFAPCNLSIFRVPWNFCFLLFFDAPSSSNFSFPHSPSFLWGGVGSTEQALISALVVFQANRRTGHHRWPSCKRPRWVSHGSAVSLFNGIICYDKAGKRSTSVSDQDCGWRVDDIFERQVRNVETRLVCSLKII